MYKTNRIRLPINNKQTLTAVLWSYIHTIILRQNKAERKEERVYYTIMMKKKKHWFSQNLPDIQCDRDEWKLGIWKPILIVQVQFRLVIIGCLRKISRKRLSIIFGAQDFTH